MNYWKEQRTEKTKNHKKCWEMKYWGFIIFDKYIDRNSYTKYHKILKKWMNEKMMIFLWYVEGKFMRGEMRVYLASCIPDC